MTKHLSDTEKALLEAWKMVKPIETKEEYRAYYDEQGKVQFLTALEHPEGDNWISISREVYVAQKFNFSWVVDGKLIEKLPTNKHYFSLTQGVKDVKIVKNHAGIVIDDNEDYPDVDYYGIEKHN